MQEEGSTYEKEAASYCAECFDILDIKDRELSNRKAEIVIVKGLVDTKDAEIQGLRLAKDQLIKTYYRDQKEWKKARRKAWWRGVKQSLLIGASIGAGTVILLSNN